MAIIQRAHHPSAEARELYNLLSSPHVQVATCIQAKPPSNLDLILIEHV